MHILIPNYNTEVPNEVYTRKNPSSLTEVIILDRYTELTEEDIVNEIVEKARKTLSNLQSSADPTDIIEEILTCLPVRNLQAIAREMPRATDVVKSCTPLPSSRIYTPKSYLSIEYAEVEPRTIEDTTKDRKEYKGIIRTTHDPEKGLGLLLGIELLIENDILPNPRKVLSLIEDRVSHSRTLRVHRISYDQELAREVINLVYSSMPEPVTRIRDSSSERKASATRSACQNLVNSSQTTPISIEDLIRVVGIGTTKTVAELTNLISHALKISKIPPLPLYKPPEEELPN